MRNVRSLSLLFLAVSFIAASCTKEGPEGPVGAAGLQGPAGAAGPAGPTGPAGTGGGVTYSTWVVSGSNWESDTALVYLARGSYDRAAPGITQAIINNGLVLAYMKGEPFYVGTNHADDVFPLPYTVGYGAQFVDAYDFVLNAPGNIRFLYKSDDPYDLEDLATISYRYIIVPGTATTGRSGVATYAGKTSAELKAMSYQQVAAYLNLPATGSNIQ